MAHTVEEVLEEALRLSPDQRVRLMTELLATLEPDTPSQRRSEAEWIQEIERRGRAAVAGSPGVSWTEARAQIKAKSANKRNGKVRGT